MFIFQTHLLFTMKAFTEGEWFRITIDEKCIFYDAFAPCSAWRRPFWDPGRFQQALPFFSTIQPGCLSYWVADSDCYSIVAHLPGLFRHNRPHGWPRDHLAVVSRVIVCRMRRFALVFLRSCIVMLSKEYSFVGWKSYTLLFWISDAMICWVILLHGHTQPYRGSCHPWQNTTIMDILYNILSSKKVQSQVISTINLTTYNNANTHPKLIIIHKHSFKTP